MAKKKQMIPEEEYNKAPELPKEENPVGELGIAKVDEKPALTDTAHVGDELPTPTGAALENTQAAELDALQAHNQAQYNSIEDILEEDRKNQEALKQKDELAQKRSNAYRYIAGIGDTLSSLANLVGTAHGAANQKQTYNGSKVVQMAEAARKERKLEMEKISNRIREMEIRQRELKSAGSLAEAQLKAKQEKERFAEKIRLDKEAREQKRYEEQMAFNKQKHEDDMALGRERIAAQTVENEKNYNLKLSQLSMQKAEHDAKYPNSYPIVTSAGTIEIPKEKVNDANINQIFNSLPEEIKALAKGKAITTYDEYGNKQTSYAEPDLNAKLAAIGVVAENDESVQDALKRLSTGEAKEKKKKPNPMS